MVPNLPYFMVQWDYKGEQGYGHIIEGTDDAPGKGMDDDDSGMVHEGDTGGGEFPKFVTLASRTLQSKLIFQGSLQIFRPRNYRQYARIGTQKMAKTETSRLQPQPSSQGQIR